MASLQANLRKGDARHAAAFRGLIAALVPDLAAKLEPELPTAAPARKVVRTR